MLEPSWNSAVLRPDEILVVHYPDPKNQPDSGTLANLAANMPDHLRGRVIFMAHPVELEVIAREQRPLLIKQLKELVEDLERPHNRAERTDDGQEA